MRSRSSNWHKRGTLLTSRVIITRHLREALMASVCFVFVPLAVGQTSTGQSFAVVERGEDYAVYQRVSARTDAASGATVVTNQFTLLENSLNYLEDGQWKQSEDVIEPSPNGAVARRGPNKATFSPDLNSPAVFDILTSDGKRLRGGLRAVQLTDAATGKSVVLATVKASAPGELLPPNRIVYRNAFDGLEAEVLLVWKHNAFSQDLVTFRAVLRGDGSLVDRTGAVKLYQGAST